MIRMVTNYYIGVVLYDYFFRINVVAGEWIARVFPELNYGEPQHLSGQSERVDHVYFWYVLGNLIVSITFAPGI